MREQKYGTPKWVYYLIGVMALIFAILAVNYLIRWIDQHGYCHRRGMEVLIIPHAFFCVDKEGRVYR